MGPLASLAQRDEVRARVQEPPRSPDRRSLDGIEVVGADPAKGAFLGRSCCGATSRWRHARVHEREAFGQVSHADALRHGRGRILSPSAARAASWARSSPTTTLSPATWCWASPPITHGCWSRTATAARTDRPRLAAPALIHGGPGRAGGGEDGRDPRCPALHATHGPAGFASHLEPSDGQVDHGRTAARDRGPPLPQAFRGA